MKEDDQTTILWIEEELEDILTEYYTYLIKAGYKIINVSTAQEAELLIKKREYAIIILDIRIIPGVSKKWIDLHQLGEKRLGLILLREFICPYEDLKKRVIIFSNEIYSDVKDELCSNGIPESHFIRKRNIHIPEQLEEIINRVQSVIPK